MYSTTKQMHFILKHRTILILCKRFIISAKNTQIDKERAREKETSIMSLTVKTIFMIKYHQQETNSSSLVVEHCFVELVYFATSATFNFVTSAI